MATQKGSGSAKADGSRTSPLLDRIPVVAKELIAGGLAGAFAKTATAPLERVKIIFQTKSPGFESMGIRKSLSCIYKREGFAGFFRGNVASVVRVVPYAALHFSAYEEYRRWIVDLNPHANHDPVTDLVAGAFAGATAVILTYPLDVVRTRLAWQVSGVGAGADPVGAAAQGAGEAVKGSAFKGGVRDALRLTVREEGVRGLYRGIGPTLLGIFPYAGLKFYTYEALKAVVMVGEGGSHSMSVKLACGAVAGLLGQTAAYPLDVVRRQMQIQTGSSAAAAHLGELHLASSTASPAYRHTWHALHFIVTTQGWRQLYAGLSLNYLKIIPSVAISFTIYDTTKAWLQVPPRQSKRKTAASSG